MEGNDISSLEANHLIWVWIMKVKRPKNQADFIEVLFGARWTYGFRDLIAILSTDFGFNWNGGFRNSSNPEVIPIGS